MFEGEVGFWYIQWKCHIPGVRNSSPLITRELWRHEWAKSLFLTSLRDQSTYLPQGIFSLLFMSFKWKVSRNTLKGKFAHLGIDCFFHRILLRLAYPSSTLPFVSFILEGTFGWFILRVCRRNQAPPALSDLTENLLHYRWKCAEFWVPADVLTLAHHAFFPVGTCWQLRGSPVLRSTILLLSLSSCMAGHTTTGVCPC